MYKSVACIRVGNDHSCARSAPIGVRSRLSSLYRRRICARAILHTGKMRLKPASVIAGAMITVNRRTLAKSAGANTSMRHFTVSQHLGPAAVLSEVQMQLVARALVIETAFVAQRRRRWASAAMPSKPKRRRSAATKEPGVRRRQIGL